MSHPSVKASLALLALCVVPAIVTGGTLDQIKKSGEIRVGYRTDAPPLSFNDSSGQAAGYSVELCKRIATAVNDFGRSTGCDHQQPGGHRVWRDDDNSRAVREGRLYPDDLRYRGRLAEPGELGG